jgi:hypothetical protein
MAVIKTFVAWLKRLNDEKEQRKRKEKAQRLIEVFKKVRKKKKGKRVEKPN